MIVRRPQSCEVCFYYLLIAKSCRRYPQQRPKAYSDWCGEWRALAPMTVTIEREIEVPDRGLSVPEPPAPQPQGKTLQDFLAPLLLLPKK